MKKLIIYLSIIVALFGGLYVLNVVAKGSTDNPYGIREGNLSPLTRAQFDDPHYQNIILPEQLESKLDEKGSGFVFFFKPDCPHCKATVPLLMPIVDELNIDMPMYNLLEFPEGWSDYNLDSTPTLVYYQDGKEIDRKVGGMEVTPGDGGWTKEQYTEFLKQYKD